MNKAELIKKIAEKAELSQSDSKKALEATIDAIKEALATNDSVSLIGFGTFTQKKRAARKGVNPKTGDKIKIAAAKVPAFRPGAAFKEIIQLGGKILGGCCGTNPDYIAALKEII